MQQHEAFGSRPEACSSPPLILNSMIYTYNTSKMKQAFPSHLVQKMIDGLFPDEGEDFLALHVKQSMKEGKCHSIKHMFFSLCINKQKWHEFECLMTD